MWLASCAYDALLEIGRMTSTALNVISIADLTFDIVRSCHRFEYIAKNPFLKQVLGYSSCKETRNRLATFVSPRDSNLGHQMSVVWKTL